MPEASHVDLPELRSSDRWREYHAYSLRQRAFVVRGWLFDGLTHRQLDDQILGLDRAVTKGYQAMGILHAIGLRGDSRGIYKNFDQDLVMTRLQDAGGYELLLENLGGSDSKELTLQGLRKLEIEELFAATKRTSLERKLRIRDQEGRVPDRIKIVSYTYKRNPDVVAEALNRANGRCDRCNSEAPFIRASDNSPYLEVHHIKPLSEGGSDSLENVIALCPNCHRNLHFGQLGRDQY